MKRGLPVSISTSNLVVPTTEPTQLAQSSRTYLPKSPSVSSLVMTSNKVLSVLKEIIKVVTTGIVTENEAYLERIMDEFELINENRENPLDENDLLEHPEQYIWLEWAMAEAEARLWLSGYLEHPGISNDSLANSLYYGEHSEQFKQFCRSTNAEKAILMVDEPYKLELCLPTKIALAVIEKLNDSNTILKGYHKEALKKHILSYDNTRDLKPFEYNKGKEKEVGLNFTINLGENFANFRQRLSPK